MVSHDGFFFGARSGVPFFSKNYVFKKWPRNWVFRLVYTRKKMRKITNVFKITDKY